MKRRHFIVEVSIPGYMGTMVYHFTGTIKHACKMASQAVRYTNRAAYAEIYEVVPFDERDFYICSYDTMEGFYCGG